MPAPSSFLAAISARRHRDADAASSPGAARRLQIRAGRRRHNSLAARLRAAVSPQIIAETKRASPSAGILVESYDPARIARAYAAAGAAAISVLTEPHHFKGSLDDLAAVRAVVGVPLLRKDFITHPFQVLEAAAYGADVVLFIAALLDSRALEKLHRAATDLGLESLIEVHTAAELPRALDLEGAMIGVNNRNLADLRTDLAVARRMAASIPRDRLAVAESGLKMAADIGELFGLGYRGFLVGEALLKSASPGAALRQLIGCKTVPTGGATC